jgi:DNA-binding MarR family transcriptional regulator
VSTHQPEHDDRELIQKRREQLGFDEVEAGAWINFETVATLLHNAVERGLARAHRLSLADVQLLAHLRSRGPTPMGVLAEMLMVTPSALTQQIQRLERRLLVRRDTSIDDGRRVLAAITREGVSVTRASLETYARLVRGHFLDTLSRRQMIALGDGCRRISANLKAAETAQDPPDG